MDPQIVSESIARQLAQVWELHRTPAFVDYLLQSFGCEPLKPVDFAGVFCLQMIGGYFFPDLPAGPPGPAVERLWLMNGTGFQPASRDELRAVENLESDNPLVIYDSRRTSYKLMSSQPWLQVYPRFRFCVRDNALVFHEEFGFSAGCKKSARLVINGDVNIKDVRIIWTIWQSHIRHLTPQE